jgi:hypothetical protein
MSKKKKKARQYTNKHNGQLNKSSLNLLSKFISQFKKLKNRFPKAKKAKASLYALFAFIALIIGFFMDAGGLYSSIISGLPPNIQMAFYEINDGEIKLIDPSHATVYVDPEDILNQTVSIPLNIAIRNTGNKPLELVRIEFAYDSSIDVTSAGKMKIDPENRVLVYEHNLGTLESMDFFTPIQTVDVIHVPFILGLVPTLTYTNDNVPFYFLILVGSESDNQFVDKVIVLNVRVFSKDRPVIMDTIRINLKANIDIFGLPNEKSNATSVEIQNDDIELFNRIPSDTAIILDHWEKYDAFVNSTIKYYKVEQGNGIYQYIFLDDNIRKVIADTNSDGWVEYELIDANLDSKPDSRYVFNPQTMYMLDWQSEAIP